MTEFAPVGYILGCATTVARDPEVGLRFDVPFLRPSLRERFRLRGNRRIACCDAKGNRDQVWRTPGHNVSSLAPLGARFNGDEGYDSFS